MYPGLGGRKCVGADEEGNGVGSGTWGGDGKEAEMGDLLVRYVVVFPSVLTGEQRRGLREVL